MCSTTWAWWKLPTLVSSPSRPARSWAALTWGLSSRLSAESRDSSRQRSLMSLSDWKVISAAPSSAARSTKSGSVCQLWVLRTVVIVTLGSSTPSRSLVSRRRVRPLTMRSNVPSGGRSRSLTSAVVPSREICSRSQPMATIRSTVLSLSRVPLVVRSPTRPAPLMISISCNVTCLRMKTSPPTR